MPPHDCASKIINRAHVTIVNRERSGSYDSPESRLEDDRLIADGLAAFAVEEPTGLLTGPGP